MLIQPRYALQCESLKVDAAAVRTQLSELTKNSNKNTLIELTERLEAAERDNTELREQLVLFTVQTKDKEGIEHTIDQFLPDEVSKVEQIPFYTNYQHTEY